MEKIILGEKRCRKFYIVIEGDRVLYRSKSRAKARAYQRGWNSPTVVVLKVRRTWCIRLQM